MTSVTRTALLPYADHELYRMVTDVDRYRDFLPFCIGSEVLERREDEMLARIAFAKLGLSQALTTRNRLVPHQRVELELVDGPFRALQGAWEFKALAAQACKVSFTIDFEVEASYLSLAVGSAINQAALTAVDAFSRRAVQLYGKR